MSKTIPSEQKEDAANPMDVYKTRGRANTPTRIKLFHPGTLKETSDWLDVRSSLSDEFRDAKDIAMQEAAVISDIPHEPTKKERTRDAKLRMVASLVSGWSFSVPCTPDNVIAFFKEAPQIEEYVKNTADDHAAFFKDA